MEKKSFGRVRQKACVRRCRSSYGSNIFDEINHVNNIIRNFIQTIVEETDSLLLNKLSNFRQPVGSSAMDRLVSVTGKVLMIVSWAYKTGESYLAMDIKPARNYVTNRLRVLQQCYFSKVGSNASLSKFKEHLEKSSSRQVTFNKKIKIRELTKQFNNSFQYDFWKDIWQTDRTCSWECNSFEIGDIGRVWAFLHQGTWVVALTIPFSPVFCWQEPLKFWQFAYSLWCRSTKIQIKIEMVRETELFWPV